MPSPSRSLGVQTTSVDGTPEQVQRWLDERGYLAVSSGGGGAVTLYDYDGEAGISFERKTLAEACALADRFIAEVPSVDDVGAEASERAVQEWLAKNDPDNDAYESRSPSSGIPEDAGTGVTGGYGCICGPKPRTAYTRSDLEAVAREAIRDTMNTLVKEREVDSLAAEVVTRYLASRTQSKERG